MDVKTAYEQWLHDFAADADTIADLKAIANDPAEIEDRFYTELSFGTAGMRGVLGAGMNRMNRYNVRRATKGLAKYLLQNPQEAQRGVVIAYDSRRFSAEFARDTALVLAHEAFRRICLTRSVLSRFCPTRFATSTPSPASSSPPATIRRSTTAIRSTPRTARRSARKPRTASPRLSVLPPIPTAS